MRLYKLVVTVPGCTIDVIGTEVDLRSTFNNWIEHGEESPEGNDKIVIRGDHDNYQRDPVSHAVQRSMIICMSLIPWP